MSDGKVLDHVRRQGPRPRQGLQPNLAARFSTKPSGKVLDQARGQGSLIQARKARIRHRFHAVESITLHPCQWRGQRHGVLIWNTSFKETGSKRVKKLWLLTVWALHIKWTIQQALRRPGSKHVYIHKNHNSQQTSQQVIPLHFTDSMQLNRSSHKIQANDKVKDWMWFL